MGTTISALVKGYLDTGEEKYFEELLERFSPLIKAYARKLYYLEYDDREGLKIGALTTLRTIETSPLVKEKNPAVAHAAKVVASTQIRT
jgi:hypothetical protein